MLAESSFLQFSDKIFRSAVIVIILLFTHMSGYMKLDLPSRLFEKSSKILEERYKAKFVNQPLFHSLSDGMQVPCALLM
jgi:hypothetical protein